MMRKGAIRFAVQNGERGGQTPGWVDMGKNAEKIYARQSTADSPAREAEDRTRLLSLQLIEEQEKERGDIGRELHNEVGESLSILKLAAYEASRKAPADVKPLIEKMRTVVDEALERVLAISASLRSGTPEGPSFLEGLFSYFEHYESRTGIRVNFSHSGMEMKLAPPFQMIAYRILQEALANVARHAGVDRVDVAISCAGGVLNLYVEDSGCGFDQTKQEADSGGLAVMKCRAGLAGGSLIVESSPGAGTRIIVEIPISYPSQAR